MSAAQQRRIAPKDDPTTTSEPSDPSTTRTTYRKPTPPIDNLYRLSTLRDREPVPAINHPNQRPTTRTSDRPPEPAIDHPNQRSTTRTNHDLHVSTINDVYHPTAGQNANDDDAGSREGLGTTRRGQLPPLDGNSDDQRRFGKPHDTSPREGLRTTRLAPMTTMPTPMAVGQAREDNDDNDEGEETNTTTRRKPTRQPRDTGRTAERQRR
jgi:hypothetical protein